MQITEVLDSPGEWPFSDVVYVVTTASAREVNRWAARLQPDLPHGESVTPDFGNPRAPGAPAVPPGYHVVTLAWD